MKDSEILEFLLTSELEDVQKKEDLKDLIFKFRYFYRILHSNLSHKCSDLDFMERNLNQKIKELERENLNLKIQNSDLQNQIDLLPKPNKSKFNFFNLFRKNI